MSTRRRLSFVLGLAIGPAGCEAPQDDTRAESDAPPMPGKADLPNDDMTSREHDTWGYRAIAEHFAEAGFDLAADPSALDAMWPLDDDQTVILSRYGTPVQNTLAGWGWYFHSGADIARSSPEVDRTVRAPVSGEAKVFDWAGERPNPFQPYSSVVAIWNPESKVLVQLMHVSPAAPLRHSAFTRVEQGQVIGQLAAPPSLAPDQLEDYFHTHVNMIDGESMTMFNPLRHLPYHDEVAPEVVDFYALDHEAAVQTRLVDGEIDLVLEVADVDDDSGRNFEVAAIEYEVRDDAGTVLARSERCEFDTLIASIEEGVRPPVVDLLDFGNAGDQLGPGGWAHNDQGVALNTYRYALTQFAARDDGFCEVQRDDEGFVTVTSSMTRLEVSARLWDPSGNVRAWSGSLER